MDKWKKYLNKKILNEAGFLDELGSVADDLKTIKNSLPGKIIGGAIKKHKEKKAEEALGTAKDHLDNLEMKLSNSKPDSDEFESSMDAVETLRYKAEKDKKEDVVKIYEDVIEKFLGKKSEYFMKIHETASIAISRDKKKKVAGAESTPKEKERNHASAVLKSMVKNLDQDNRTRTEIIDYFGEIKDKIEAAHKRELEQRKNTREQAKKAKAQQKPTSPATSAQPATSAKPATSAQPAKPSTPATSAKPVSTAPKKKV